ncbi:MAG: hypothetical protein V1809_11540 [Planctomycetota bacterium]
MKTLMGVLSAIFQLAGSLLLAIGLICLACQAFDEMWVVALSGFGFVVCGKMFQRHTTEPGPVKRTVWQKWGMVVAAAVMTLYALSLFCGFWR